MTVQPRPRKVNSAGAEFIALHPLAPTDPDETLVVDCTITQARWIEAHIDHVEPSPADADRCRFVYKDGRKSAWFTTTWKLMFSHVAPLTE